MTDSDSSRKGRPPISAPSSNTVATSSLSQWWHQRFEQALSFVPSIRQWSTAPTATATTTATPPLTSPAPSPLLQTPLSSCRQSTAVLEEEELQRTGLVPEKPKPNHSQMSTPLGLPRAAIHWPPSLLARNSTTGTPVVAEEVEAPSSSGQPLASPPQVQLSESSPSLDLGGQNGITARFDGGTGAFVDAPHQSLGLSLLNARLPGQSQPPSSAIFDGKLNSLTPPESAACLELPGPQSLYLRRGSSTFNCGAASPQLAAIRPESISPITALKI